MKKFNLRLFTAIFASFCFCVSAEAQTRQETFAITNAQIATVSGPVISRGTIVIRNGLIESVGGNARVPADARIIDGTSLAIYPGFIDAYTSLGLSSPTPQRSPQPGQQAQPTQAAQTNQTQPSNSNYPEGLRPEANVFEQLKAGEAQFETNRNAGFTTVLTVSRDGVFNGQSAVINLAGDSVSEMIVRTPFAEHITLTTVRGGTYPTSLMGTFSALRQMFLDAQRFQEITKMYDKNPRGLRRPEADLSLEALIPVLNREMPIVFNANSEIEIIRVLDLAREFNLRAIIAGGQEAWKVASRLKSQNVPVLLSLNYPKRTAAAAPEADAESMDVLRLRAETPKTPARLQQAGVKFAFQSGGMQNINDFLANAKKSVENGLDRNAAIRAMTLSSAEILGIDNRLGSIEAGKIANLVVTRGDVFDKSKTVTHVFVDGKLFEPKLPARPSAAGTTGGQPSALANVGGVFNITVEIPGQPLQGTLNLTQQEAILTGSFQSQLGNVPIKDGRVTAEGFNFTMTVEFGGSTYEVAVVGRVSGNQISGTMTTPQGPISFNGTKTP
ncbi:MAG: amidohydrolase family protein [Acidobacteria bacterium]|nr:amidohydrolase family protein [Acidobacteriota bacterium]MCA1637419.1 amidohydrolase family protein [Acidobacteriota bacterium]